MRLQSYALERAGPRSRAPSLEERESFEFRLGTSDMSASVSDIQRLLEGLSPSSDKYQRLLLGLLTHQDLRRHTRGLRESDLLAFVELIDNVSRTYIQLMTSDFP